MLGKLLKYEIKATGRIFLPIYLALLALTIITKVLLMIAMPDVFLDSTSGTSFDIPLGISVTLYFIIIVALSVMTLIVIVQRFYKNLLTDEGYLMFTIPVETWKLIMSKLIVGLMWTFVCVFTVALSILILALGNFSIMEMNQGISMLYAEFQNQFGMSPNILIAEFIILMIVETVASVLMIYVSIAIGQLFSQHRIMAAFGAYIVISIVLQIVMTLLIALIPAFGLEYLMNSQINQMKAVEVFINGITVFNIISAVAFYFITNYILKNRLNLE
ncbi:MAG: ABC transporter permease [Eubacteriaceae bacterium]|nr:ABC transporter permease [Eubacteriaceae bacterium]